MDRAVSSLDAASADRTIEIEETAEEAVVSKTARLVEEIDLKKHIADRVETVSDPLRRTEVDIEDERIGKEGLSDETLKTGDRARRGL